MRTIISLSNDPLIIAEDESLFIAARLQWRRRVEAAHRTKNEQQYFRLMDELSDFLKVTAANIALLSPAAKERLSKWFD
jgi:hypothetical protein